MDLNDFLLKIQCSDTIPETTVMFDDIFNTLELLGYSYVHMNYASDYVFKKNNNDIVETLIVFVNEDLTGYIKECLFFYYGVSLKHTASYSDNLKIEEKEINPAGSYRDYTYYYSHKNDSSLDYIELCIRKDKEHFDYLPEIDVSKIIYKDNIIKSVEFQYIGIQLEKTINQNFKLTYDQEKNSIIMLLGSGTSQLSLVFNKESDSIYKNYLESFYISEIIVEILFDLNINRYTPLELISIFPKKLSEEQQMVVLMNKS